MSKSSGPGTRTEGIEKDKPTGSTGTFGETDGEARQSDKQGCSVQVELSACKLGRTGLEGALKSESKSTGQGGSGDQDKAPEVGTWTEEPPRRAQWSGRPKATDKSKVTASQAERAERPLRDNSGEGSDTTTGNGEVEDLTAGTAEEPTRVSSPKSISLEKGSWQGAWIAFAKAKFCAKSMAGKQSPLRGPASPIPIVSETGLLWGRLHWHWLRCCRLRSSLALAFVCLVGPRLGRLDLQRLGALRNLCWMMLSMRSFEALQTCNSGLRRILALHVWTLWQLRGKDRHWRRKSQIRRSCRMFLGLSQGLLQPLEFLSLRLKLVKQFGTIAGRFLLLSNHQLLGLLSHRFELNLLPFQFLLRNLEIVNYLLVGQLLLERTGRMHLAVRLVQGSSAIARWLELLQFVLETFHAGFESSLFGLEKVLAWSGASWDSWILPSLSVVEFVWPCWDEPFLDWALSACFSGQCQDCLPYILSSVSVSRCHSPMQLGTWIPSSVLTAAWCECLLWPPMVLKPPRTAAKRRHAGHRSRPIQGCCRSVLCPSFHDAWVCSKRLPNNSLSGNSMRTWVNWDRAKYWSLLQARGNSVCCDAPEEHSKLSVHVTDSVQSKCLRLELYESHL